MQKEVPKIEADLSILYWIDEQMLLKGQRAALVTENGQTIGLITLNDAIKCPRAQWNNTPVRKMMTPADQFYTVKPSNNILEVLQIMQERNINQVPVMDEGEIVGWIDREHLLRILRLHSLIDR